MDTPTTPEPPLTEARVREIVREATTLRPVGPEWWKKAVRVNLGQDDSPPPEGTAANSAR
jgi:hypothetical protein